jgi:hypothetical protein
MDDGEVAIASELTKEGADLVGCERLDQRARHLHLELKVRRPSAEMETERPVAARSGEVGCRCARAHAAGHLVSGDEAIPLPASGEASIDGARASIRSPLLADPVEQVALAQPFDASTTTAEPANQHDQVECVSATGPRRQAARLERVEKPIGLA